MRSIAALNKWIAKNRPELEIRPTNEPSVVLWVKVGDQCILLGGDLECTNDHRTGWSVILEESVVIQEDRAELLKIPHHGSENAHHDGIWNMLMESQPFAVATPFRSKHLPTSEDCQRIASLTPNAYITSPNRIQKVKFRESSTRRTFGEIVKSSNNLYSRTGHVRLRKKIGEPNNQWKVELFGKAYQLKQPE